MDGRHHCQFFSSTKNVTALAALILVDRGLLDPFTPVAKYWPEFAANGKDQVEVRHILSHTSGVSGWEMPFTLEEIYDWARSTSQLAAQAPSDVQTFAATPPTSETAPAAKTTAWRRADIGSGNGHGNARSLVRALAPIALDGTANGVRVLSSGTIDLIFQEQARGTELVLAMPVRWGIGFGLPHPEAVPDIPDEQVCYWGGWGGSMAVMHPSRRATFAYVMNKMGQVTSSGTDRTRKYTRLIYQGLT